jgi:heme ABC exporter ATP-binding subunit CcmA
MSESRISATGGTQQSAAIDATGVARRFGANWVLRGISLRVSRGEVVGLLGANGTGKSTLLRILATLLRPHAGTAQVFGYDVVASPANVRALVGYLGHAPGLYDDLTARENLEFAADMLDRDRRTVGDALERVGLFDVAGQSVRGFSSGMQRRLAIARLMLIRPRVLLLDEPYANLDAAGIDLMNSLIADWVDDGCAALIVLHETAPATRILNQTLTIVDGRIAPRPTMVSDDDAAVPRLASR